MAQTPTGRRDVTSPDSWYARLKRSYYASPQWIHHKITVDAARLNAQSANSVWTNSCFSRESLYTAYSIDSTVVHYGTDTSVFYPLSLPRSDFVLAVGALHPFKGYKFLIESLGRIPQAIRPRLIIAANAVDPLYQQQLTQLSQRLNVEYTVQKIWDDRVLVNLYNQALALAYTPVMEPFGLVALEAMACGTPVVAVREGGIRESVQDDVTGILTDRQEDAFADAIQRIIQDGQLRKRLGDAGPAYVAKQWSWEHAVDRIETLFNTALAGHRNVVI